MAFSIVLFLPLSITAQSEGRQHAAADQCWQSYRKQKPEDEHREVFHAAINQDGSQLVVAINDAPWSMLIDFDIVSAKELWHVPLDTAPEQIHFSGDSSLLALGYKDRLCHYPHIEVRKGSTGEIFSQLQDSEHPYLFSLGAQAIAFSPDNSYLVAELGIDLGGWKLPSGKNFFTIETPGPYGRFGEEGIHALIVSPDNKFFLGSAFSKINVFEKIKEIPYLNRSLHVVGDSYGSAFFSKDGKFIIAGAYTSKNIRLTRVWRVQDGTLSKTIQGCAAYGSIGNDGKTLVCIDPGQVKLVDLTDNRKSPTVYQIPFRGVFDILFTPQSGNIYAYQAVLPQMWANPEKSFAFNLVDVKTGQTKSFILPGREDKR